MKARSCSVTALALRAARATRHAKTKTVCGVVLHRQGDGSYQTPDGVWAFDRWEGTEGGWYALGPTGRHFASSLKRAVLHHVPAMYRRR